MFAFCIEDYFRASRKSLVYEVELFQSECLEGMFGFIDEFLASPGVYMEMYYSESARKGITDNAIQPGDICTAGGIEDKETRDFNAKFVEVWDVDHEGGTYQNSLSTYYFHWRSIFLMTSESKVSKFFHFVFEILRGSRCIALRQMRRRVGG